MSLKDELLYSFKKGDNLTRLIYLNLAFFLFYYLIYIVGSLFLKDMLAWFQYLYVPASPLKLLLQPWSLVSYMFLHEGFIHILFNLLNLYWFGKLFLQFFNQKQLVGVYLIGGFMGAILYVLAYNLFPYYQLLVSNSYLLGASASIMAVLMAVAVYSPNLELQLILIGRVKLKYIATVMFFISLFSVVGQNAGGNIAHLGGAFAGYLFARSMKKGKDFTSWINGIIDFFVDLLARKPKMKVRYGNQPLTDAQWNEKKRDQSRQLDLILDKIKQSGYDSLTKEEKKLLFDQSSKT